MHLTRTRSLSIFVVLALALCSLEGWLVHSLYFPPEPELIALAVTLDITLGLPLLAYFPAIRPRYLPRPAFLPIFLLSVGTAGFILPVAHQSYLDRIKSLLPLVELVVLVLLLMQVRTILASYRVERHRVLYPVDAVERALQAVLGPSPVSRFLVAELSLLYYTCLG